MMEFAQHGAPKRWIKPREIPLVSSMARAIGRALNLPPGKRSFINAIGYQSAYASTDPNRLFLEGFLPRNATADQTLTWNLTNLIAQCRQLERANASIRALVEGWCADIVGTGIDVDPDTGDDVLNAKIRDEWHRWCENATPDGKSLWEVQEASMREWCTGGASLLRVIIDKGRVKDDHLPICFAPLEVEWLCLFPVAPIADGSVFTRGIEKDKQGRPIAYHVMDYELLNQLGLGNAFGGPGDVVPADQIIHGYEQRRPRQSHGEPLIAICLERAYQAGKLIDIELKASANTATISGVITSKWVEDWQASRVAVDQYGNATSATPLTTPVTDAPIGAWARLSEGESVTPMSNTRPAQGIFPFMDGINGQLAAAGRCSKYYLDKNPSGTTYSSGKRDELFNDRMRAPVQATFAKYNAGKVYEKVLPWILLKIGAKVPPNAQAKRRLFAYKLLPDKPKYMDPVKDSAASDFMIKSGLSTKEIELSQRGKDPRKIREQRVAEIQQDDADSVDRIVALNAALNKAKAADSTLTISLADILAIAGASTAPGAFLAAAAAEAAAGDATNDDNAPSGSKPTPANKGGA